jgi:hypothetical protein
MSSQIFSTFSVILLVLVSPERSSSSTDTQAALKCGCHSKTSVQLKECSPKASHIISRVSVADLPSFTQNLMQTRCRQNKTLSRKSTRVKTICVHSVVSHGRLMQ